MRLLPFVSVLPLALSGCADFASVEEACKDNVRGDKDASAAAVEVVRRISCYRRYTGLDRGNLHPRVTEAVEAHAFYLEQNGVPPDWWAEQPGNTGYSGVDSFARLAASEFLFPESQVGTFVWEVLGYVEDDRTRMIDAAMHDPFVRDVFLAPGWEAAGYAEGTDPVVGPFYYANIVLYFPSGARSTRPVTWPMDGQSGVPTSWTNPYTGDPALAGVPPVTGYPISFTVGSSEEGVGAVNPLGLVVAASTITGPDGPVEHVVVTPTEGSWGTNWSTAILFPTAPLAPEATYTVDVSLSWNTQPSRDETLAFTTGSDGANPGALARVRPPVRVD